VEELRPV